jgi:hypothetical protein
VELLVQEVKNGRKCIEKGIKGRNEQFLGNVIT